MLLNKITGHKQNINLLQFTYMYEIENKKINGKKKKKEIENTKKKNLSLYGKHKVSKTLRVQPLFGIQLIGKGKLCFLFNLL